MKIILFLIPISLFAQTPETNPVVASGPSLTVIPSSEKFDVGSVINFWACSSEAYKTYAENPKVAHKFCRDEHGEDHIDGIKISTRTLYTKALQDINAAQANAMQLIAKIKQAQDESAKALTDANDAAQKALIAAQAECGDKAQLDGKALQEKGELVCVAKVASK